MGEIVAGSWLLLSIFDFIFVNFGILFFCGGLEESEGGGKIGG